MKNYILHKRRKERQNLSAFAELIAVPSVGDLVMLSSKHIRVLSVAGKNAGDVACTIGSRIIKTPALNAGSSMWAGFAERGAVVSPETGIDIMIDTGLGKYVKVGGV